MSVWKHTKLGRKGFTLAELLVVVAIIGILCAIGVGVYRSSIEKAKEAVLLSTARQMKEALLICEMEYASEGLDAGAVYWNDEFLKAPNHEESVLYPYVGNETEDCTRYTLKVGRDSDGKQQIKGFIYETEEYRVRWNRGEEIEIEKK